MNLKNDETLIGYIGKLDDPRAPYNQKHKFIDIVTITVLGTLCGADSWNEIAEWGEANKEWLGKFLDLDNGIPSHDTINRVFQMIDADKFHEIFIEWVRSVLKKADLTLKGVIAIDGKTIRRSKEDTKSKKAIHIVSAWATEFSMVLGQEKVEEKSNEIKAIPELLRQLDINGCIVTIDAIGTQKSITKQIVTQGGEYVLQVKENQKNLYKDISLYFETEVFGKTHDEYIRNGNYAKEINGEHGRIEKREYYIVKEIEWLKQANKGFEKLNGVGACKSTVEENGEKRTNISYAIFSDENMTAKKFGKCKRWHWGIENSLHWCLDIAFNEDYSRARKDNAAENLNIIRHICLNMLKQEKSCKMGQKGKRKKCGWDLNYRLKVLDMLIDDATNKN